MKLQELDKRYIFWVVDSGRKYEQSLVKQEELLKDSELYEFYGMCLCCTIQPT